jgi:hypothetical protein
MRPILASVFAFGVWVMPVSAGGDLDTSSSEACMTAVALANKTSLSTSDHRTLRAAAKRFAASNTTGAPEIAKVIRAAKSTKQFKDAAARASVWCQTSQSVATTIATTTEVLKVSVYDGRGDADIQITKPSETNIVALHHEGQSDFIVAGRDASQQRVVGLVSTMGAYDGIVPLDFLSGQDTAFLLIVADGQWHIEIRPLSTSRTLTRSIAGTGDEVIIYAGTGGISAITHDGRSNFVVTAYTTKPTRIVNELGAYRGRVPVPSGPSVIEIKADGHWTITFA